MSEADLVQPRSLNALGLLFMVGSAVLVWGLTLWCYYRVLRGPAPESPPSRGESEPEPERPRATSAGSRAEARRG